MPARGKVLKGGSNNLRKVKIKPFSKPPTLPPNFYEQTSAGLLQGTLKVLQRGGQQQSNEQQQQTSLSLQNSYNSVENLV